MQHALKQLSLGLAVLGFCAGLLLSYGVLAGDQQGQVNLLLLLLLFALLPVAGLALSLFLLARRGGKGLAGWLLDLPLWPKHLKLALPGLSLFQGRELWFLYQTQIFTLCFSVGCLLLYLVLLLGTDINFVWRSTLLTPQDLLPVLQGISLPWSFWHEAQPSLALIEQTRDYRLQELGASPPLVGLWWKYILAAQLVYNLLPRTLMMLVARHLYLHRLRQADTPKPKNTHNVNSMEQTTSATLAELVHTVTSPYVLLDWVNAPASCHACIQQQLGMATAIIAIGPVAQSTDNAVAKNTSRVVLVKSWEPPLAELADRLREIDSSADKLILPLDWLDTSVQTPTAAHMNEWRRFAATLEGWQVLQLGSTK